jgi:hypothetical protein
LCHNSTAADKELIHKGINEALQANKAMNQALESAAAGAVMQADRSICSFSTAHT